MYNYIVDVYNKNDITISRQITEEQYKVFSEINKDNSTTKDILELKIQEGKISGNIVTNYIKKADLQNIDKDENKINENIVTKSYKNVNECFFHYKDNILIFLDTIIHKYSIKSIAENSQSLNSFIALKNVFYIRDETTLKQWGIIEKIKNCEQIPKLVICQCGIELKPIDEILNFVENYHAIIPTNLDIFDFCKNLSLKEYKMSKYNCIHCNYLFSIQDITDANSNVNSIIIYCKNKIKEFEAKNSDDISLFFNELRQ